MNGGPRRTATHRPADPPPATQNRPQIGATSRKHAGSPRIFLPADHRRRQHLRRAGFAVDESGASPTFNVELTYVGETGFQATASIGRTLKIARIYEPGDGGVYPVSAVSVMRLSARTVWRAPAELIRNDAPGS